MLFKWVREEIANYSFVTKTRFFIGRFHIFYEKDGVSKSKVLPYRATQHQVANCINKIKEEINYAEWRIKEDKRIKEAVEKDNKDSAIFYSN